MLTETLYVATALDHLHRNIVVVDTRGLRIDAGIAVFPTIVITRALRFTQEGECVGRGVTRKVTYPSARQKCL